VTSLRALVFASFAALALAACSSGKPVTMADAFDVDVFGPHQDDLHTPYVAGSQFGITVNAQQAESGWTLSSSDPDVIRVTGSLVSGTGSVTCIHPGQAVLSVLDASGQVMDSHAVSVAIPDHVGIYAEGPLLTGASDDSAVVTHASVVAGGHAMFLVRYFQQGVELYGNGALAPLGTGGVTATTTTASFATARDFLRVSPGPTGTSGTVKLSVDHAIVGELPVTAVLASAVTQVTVLAGSTEAAQKGDARVLYAHAIDASSSEVYGASFGWTIDGQSQSSLFVGAPADLFFYNYDSTVTENLAATLEK
jgi:hypothetical protein